jgi:methionyl-tRNA formyltransferase
LSRPIVFFGTPEFAANSLRALTKVSEVCAVVTAPDKPAGRGHKLQASSVKQCAEELGIPVLQPTNLKSTEFQEELKAYGAQLFVVVAFRMLPKSVWAMPKLGTINLHASLLPDYRGAAPIQWAVMNGDKSSGVTTFFIQEKIDTGAILLQREVTIADEDTAGVLQDNLMREGADVLSETVVGLFENKLSSTEQDRIDLGRPLKEAPKIYKDTCKINWSRSAKDLHNQIRGLSPYPAAFGILEEGEEISQIKIYKSALGPKIDGKVGQIEATKEEIVVNTGSGSLRVLELQKAGKRRMDAKSFLAGHPNLSQCRFV